MTASLYLADSIAIGSSTGRKVVRAADERGKSGNALLPGLSENSEHTAKGQTSNDSQAIAKAVHKAE